MNILIDTDILIDLALGRTPHDAPAGQLFDAIERRQASGFIAWHSASNFYYLVAPKQGKDGARRFLLDLTQFVDIAPSTTESLRRATQMRLRDFEDAMQVAAAMACDADVIATRNFRDYAGSPVRAAAPAQVLAMLA